jgi:hypothetical protein
MTIVNSKAPSTKAQSAPASMRDTDSVLSMDSAALKHRRFTFDAVLFAGHVYQRWLERCTTQDTKSDNRAVGSSSTRTATEVQGVTLPPRTYSPSINCDSVLVVARSIKEALPGPGDSLLGDYESDMPPGSEDKTTELASLLWELANDSDIRSHYSPKGVTITKRFDNLLRQGAVPDLRLLDSLVDQHRFAALHILFNSMAKKHSQTSKLITVQTTVPGTYSWARWNSIHVSAAWAEKRFFQSCKDGDTSVTEFFLRRRVDIDAISGDIVTLQSYPTALHIAAYFGHVELASLLIGNGARSHGAHGYCPVLEAASQGHEQMVAFLLDPYATTEARFPPCCTAVCESADGRCAIHFASKSLHGDKMINILMSKGADGDAEDGVGHTALYYACEGLHYEAAKCLLENGVHVKPRGHHDSAYDACTMHAGSDASRASELIKLLEAFEESQRDEECTAPGGKKESVQARSETSSISGGVRL